MPFVFEAVAFALLKKMYCILIDNVAGPYAFVYRISKWKALHSSNDILLCFSFLSIRPATMEGVMKL